MRVFYALQVKDIGFCCCEMADAYRESVITFGGEGEYIDGAPRLALGIKVADVLGGEFIGWRFIPIDYCPWCGRKIELIRAPFDVAREKRGGEACRRI